MTKKDALTIALSTLTDDTMTFQNPHYDGKDSTTKFFSMREVRDTIQKMIDQLSKERSDAQKQAMNEVRKAKTAAARKLVVDAVAPVLRDVLSHTQTGLTAKDIFADAQGRLPEGFNVLKIQYMLLNDIRDEVEVIEKKGEPNKYRLMEKA